LWKPSEGESRRKKKKKGKKEMKKWSSELYYHNPLPWKEVDASENNIRKITNTYNIKFYGI
jgi:hypothetical protein